MTLDHVEDRNDAAGRNRSRCGSPRVASRSRTPRGFTLIELLVVVAIVIALLAILMPSMSRAIKITNRTVCAVNLKQFGVANLSYCTDNFGMVMKTNERPGPYPFDIRKEVNPEGVWNIEAIKPYTQAWEVTGYAQIDGMGISMCPDIDKELMNRYFATRNAGMSFIEIQYSYFGGDIGQGRLYNGAEKLIVGKRVGGSDRVWMADTLYADGSDMNSSVGGWRYNHGVSGWAYNEYNWMPNQTGLYPYFEGINRLMGDGAAGWKDASEFEHIDLMFDWRLYPDPHVNRRDVAYF